MFIVETYLALVTVSIAATFTFIIRGVMDDMRRLEAGVMREPERMLRAA